METWKQRMQQEEETRRRLKEEAARKKAQEQRENNLQREAETREIQTLFEQLGVVQELQTINSQVWQNLGKIEGLSPKIHLTSNFKHYSPKQETKTEKRFGFYRTTHDSPVGGESGLSTSYTEDHLGFHDVKVTTVLGVQETSMSTSLGIELSRSPISERYRLNVSDTAALISRESFPEYTHYTYSGRQVDLYVRYASGDYTLDYRFADSNSNHPIELEFPCRNFDQEKVRDFLIRALTSSCSIRTKAKLLPSDFQRRESEELQRLQANIGKSFTR